MSFGGSVPPYHSRGRHSQYSVNRVPLIPTRQNPEYWNGLDKFPPMSSTMPSFLLFSLPFSPVVKPEGMAA